MAYASEDDPEEPGAGSEWVPVATYGMVYEADFARATLQSAGIPVLVQGGEHVAIFGPGWMGPSTRGITVMVPRECLEEAREVLAPGEETEGERE
jgi:hypothetical protein